MMSSVGGLLFVGLLFVVILGYSISWEAVRLVRAAEPDASLVVRGALQMGAFVAVALAWPFLTIWNLSRYRTAYPVSAGRLRLRPGRPLWWRCLIGGMSGLWLVGSFITTVIAPDLLARGWQAAIYVPASLFCLALIALYTDELPAREHSEPIGAGAAPPAA
jgi:hypothetical protein